MRYFFFLPVPEPLLACRVVMAALGGRTVAAARLAQAFPAGLHSTRTRTVVISPVTVTTDKDLTAAAGTDVVADTGQHRQAKADEGWIATGSSATRNRLCESTVWGMAPVSTLKSRPAPCLSHQPLLPTATTAFFPCFCASATLAPRTHANPGGNSKKRVR